MKLRIMMKPHILLCMASALTLLCSCVGERSVISVLPYPNEVKVRSGFCDLTGGLSVHADSLIGSFVKEYFEDGMGIRLCPEGAELKFVSDPEIENPEGYELRIRPGKIEVAAQGDAGWFYALQTLRQLVRDGNLPCSDIKDAPAFAWRDFMLDEARYFHGKETVKRILDDMALLKMNTFHWHLTDDAGWRIEILEYPRLTEIGARRDSTQIRADRPDFPAETGDPAYDAFLQAYHSEVFDTKPHCGYYTQDDIREIVAYAAERQIKIVPEISMPGHASAAIASYPWLGTTKKRISVPCTFGVKDEAYDVSSPEVIAFFKDVLTEVSGLFPSDYIHIGGDEVKYGQWQASPSVQEYMKDNGISNCRELQVKFTNDMCAFIEDELHKKMIGWNEILGFNCHQWGSEYSESLRPLSKNAVVQFWAGDKDILEYALDNGYRVIHSYCEDTYINYSYDQIPLERAYAFNPVPAGYDGDCIVGLGCQLWTEWIGDRQTLEFQAYPRIAAYAETGWTSAGNKSYARFRENLEPLIEYWRDKGYNISKQL